MAGNFDLKGFLNDPKVQADKPGAIRFLQQKGILDQDGKVIPGTIKTGSPTGYNPMSPTGLLPGETPWAQLARASDKPYSGPTDPTSGSGPAVESLAAVPGQLAAKTTLAIGQRSAVQSAVSSIDDMKNKALDLFKQSEQETDPVKKRQLLEQGINYAKGVQSSVASTDALQKSNLQAQRVGDIPALSDDPGRMFQQVAGRGLKTVGFMSGLAPGLSGAIYGVGSGLEKGDSAGSIALQGLTDAALFELGGSLLDKFGGTVIGKKVLSSGPVQLLNALMEPFVASPAANFANTGLAQGLNAGAGITADIIGEKAGSVVGNVLSTDTLKGIVGKPAGYIRDLFTVPGDEAAANSLIDNSFSKSIKPSVAGRATSEQSAAYKESARSVVRDIAENADKIALKDAEGNPINGVPKTRQQTLDAIGQRKIQIWRQVQAANKASGGLGATIDFNKISDSIESFANDPLNKTAFESTTNYARGVANRLRELGETDPEAAQELLSKFNARAQAYYNNPNPNDVGNALVDAMVANNTRNAIDTSIESYGGEAAKPYRDLYADYKTVERDVARSAGRGANANQKSLIDSFFDITSATDLAKALTELNPAGAAKAGIQKVVKDYITNFWSADPTIERMFTNIYKAYESGALAAPEYPGFNSEKWLDSLKRASNPDVLALPPGKVATPEEMRAYSKERMMGGNPPVPEQTPTAPMITPKPGESSSKTPPFNPAATEKFSQERASLASQNDQDAFAARQAKEAQATNEVRQRIIDNAKKSDFEQLTTRFKTKETWLKFAMSNPMLMNKIASLKTTAQALWDTVH